MNMRIVMAFLLMTLPMYVTEEDHVMMSTFVLVQPIMEENSVNMPNVMEPLQTKRVYAVVEDLVMMSMSVSAQIPLNTAVNGVNSQNAMALSLIKQEVYAQEEEVAMHLTFVFVHNPHYMEENSVNSPNATTNFPMTQESVIQEVFAPFQMNVLAPTQPSLEVKIVNIPNVLAFSRI